MNPSSSSETPQPAPQPANWTRLVAFVAAFVGLACCGVLLPCTVKVRESEGWVRSAVSLNQIGKALLAYHDAYGRFPPAVVTDKDGRPLYSWRVALLPFLDHDHLYKQLDLKQPWDSPHNKPLLAKTPKCYLPALGGGPDGPGLTRYQVFVGPGTAFE